jgi:phosphomannomutase
MAGFFIPHRFESILALGEITAAPRLFSPNKSVFMPLIKSVSGIRGTIGGTPDEGLTPLDIVKFVSAYSTIINEKTGQRKGLIVIGRDARISGEMVAGLVSNTLIACGIDVLDFGLSTTPSIEMAVTRHKANGGIILTASHNPGQWNALKLLNEKGEFISEEDGERIKSMTVNHAFTYADVSELGKITSGDDSISKHIEEIVRHPLVDIGAIQKRGFRVAVDCVNSTGGLALPALLRALGVSEMIELYTEPSGHFPHNPEPLPEHLTEISALCKTNAADVGFVVDPDVDRLAIVCEDGSMFGEEYTLVAVADYVLNHRPGNTVSNLSSSRALRDVTMSKGGRYSAAAVGEVHVVSKMKETNAVIGGEGNGGVILPDLHYGRDALIGIALFLTHLAKEGKTCSELRSKYPSYFMSKQKADLPKGTDTAAILATIANRHRQEHPDMTDGVKIDFADSWVHMRRSNTEPIIRIYSEAKSSREASALADRFKSEVLSLIEGT